MAKYRPIFTRIWKDPDFMDLDSVAKLIFIYLCTNDLTTDSGIYAISFKTISSETAIPLETVRERLSNGLIRNIEYDLSTKYVFVVKFKKYNAGGKPALVQKGIANDFKISKQTYLWNIFIKEYPEFEKAILEIGEPLADPSLTVTQPLPNSPESSRTKPKPKPKPKPNIALLDKSNKAGPSGRHFENRVGDLAEKIVAACLHISKLPQKHNGQKFNPFQWVQFHTNKNYHPEAILYALEEVAKPLFWKDQRTGPWPYATKIIETKNGNYHERDHITEAEQFKDYWISPELKEAIKNIGH